MRVCRTCLQVIKCNSPSYNVDIKEAHTADLLTLKQKLAGCVPELRLDIVPNPIMCGTCVTALNLAYEFKKRCLNSEDTIYGYLSESGCDHVSDLNDVICKKNEVDRRSLKPAVYLVHNGDVEETSNRHLIVGLGNMSYGVIVDNVRSENDNIKRAEIKCDLKENSIDIKDDFGLNGDVTDVKLELEPKEEIIPDDNFLFPGNEKRARVQTVFNSMQSKDRIDDSNTKEEIAHKSNHPFAAKQQKARIQRDKLETKFQGADLYKCRFCKYTTNERIFMKMHWRTHVFKCLQCNYHTTNQRLFLAHISFRRRLKIRMGKTLYKCKLCEFRTSTRSHLKQHREAHANALKFSCSLCSYTTVHKTLLMTHMKNHTGETRFKCNFCGCAFTNRKILAIHMRKHIGERCTK